VKKAAFFVPAAGNPPVSTASRWRIEMGRVIKLGKLTWRDDFEALCLQATTRRGGDYAVLDLEQLGYSDGYGARYSPAHRRNVMPDWISLGKFRTIEAAQQRCEAHFTGEAYTPLERKERGL
jgi:hypothetical protein